MSTLWFSAVMLSRCSTDSKENTSVLFTVTVPEVQSTFSLHLFSSLRPTCDKPGLKLALVWEHKYKKIKAETWWCIRNCSVGVVWLTVTMVIGDALCLHHVLERWPIVWSKCFKLAVINNKAWMILKAALSDFFDSKTVKSTQRNKTLRDRF